MPQVRFIKRPYKQKHPYIALRGCVRTLELEREWGLRPQPGVEPLHPVLTTITITILIQTMTTAIQTMTTAIPIQYEDA